MLDADKSQNFIKNFIVKNHLQIYVYNTLQVYQIKSNIFYS